MPSLNTTNPVHQAGELRGIIRSDEEVQVICHQTHRIKLVRDFGLCPGEHCQQHIPSQSFSNQKLTAIAPQRDVKRMPLRQLAWFAGHLECEGILAFTLLLYLLVSWHTPAGFD